MRDALLADLRAAALLPNVGSLLRPHLSLAQIDAVRRVIAGADTLFTQGLNDRVLALLEELETLARPYEVVVANP